GCDLDLSLAPLKYDGLRPWEILLSEAQERMTLAVPRENIDYFLDLAREMDVEAAVLGEFTRDGLFRVSYQKKPVACLDMDFLHNGLSQMRLEAVWERPEFDSEDSISANQPQCDATLLKTMLSRLNVCSREYIIRQYDHEVQGGSVIKPLVGVKSDGPADAAVVRPDLEKDRGLVISNGICPKFSDYDAYWMMANAIDEAVRNNVAVGGDISHMAGVDNFCWCDPVVSPKNPDGRYKLAQLVRANEALAHFCRAYGVPCVSGKDSMKNDYVFGDTRISIPPTVLYSVISVIQDVKNCVTSDFKLPEEDIYILGLTARELAGSEYYSELGIRAGAVPQVDAVSARQRYQMLNQAINKGLVSACHDLSDGGLGVALAEMAIAGRTGAVVDMDDIPVAGREMSWSEILYSESASRFLVTARPQCRDQFEDVFKGTHLARIGRTTAVNELRLQAGGSTLFAAEVDELARAWMKTLDW
ncbi:MAG: AIR synthase-related protein, partial [Desulfonatronovibrio sp.]